MRQATTKNTHDLFAIVHHTDVSAAAGGPPGYLYNLFCGFSDNKPDFIHLAGGGQRDRGKQKKSVGNLIRRNQTLRIILFYMKQGIAYRRELMEKINTYKMIHVHTSESAVYVRAFCKYKGHLIFTPHRPETLSKEIIAGLPDKKHKYLILNLFLNTIEKLSYKYCDAFIFPSRGAAHIYKRFPGYVKYGMSNPHEYVYTGIRKKEVTIGRETYREKLGIARDTFLIAYIGRHSSIKGYDRLVGIYPRLRDYDIEVAAAGKISDIEFPKDKGWHELGYITDSQNLINAADLVVAPNRDTYFDLIILEALAQGKRVITSNTGGSNDIAKDTSALDLFDNEDESDLLTKILEAKDLDKQKVYQMENDGISFCRERCGVDRFADNYLKCVQRLYRSFSN